MNARGMPDSLAAPCFPFSPSLGIPKLPSAAPFALGPSTK